MERVLAGRFEILARLGAGGMGEVFRARDRALGHDVALKVLPALEPTALMRFKHEFRAVHDVRHPHLVALHELHEDRGTWFFTMQLIDGVELTAWTGRGGGHDEARLRAVLPQIADALHCLHGAGLVHRDVKPSNILVTRSGHAVVLDFGLIAPAWSPGDGRGTPAYMAPEQLDGDIGPAADWYAVGVLVFRLLTGRFPFQGAAEVVMERKAHTAAPRLREIRPSAPGDLAELADRLLARRPEHRLRGDQVLAALGAGPGASRVAREIFVGRDRELAALCSAVDDRMQGEAFAVSVVGDSGIGKTALLRAFADEIGGRAWVVNGRCWEREAVPYKGFDGVIDELAARIAAEDWQLDGGRWGPILTAAFPVLGKLPGFGGAGPVADPAGDRGREPARISAAVRWLVSEVAARQALVVVIDDLHWADRDTLALLPAMLEPPLANVLLVVGSRAPVALDLRLASRLAVRTIALGPLSAADSGALVGLVVRELGGGGLDPEAIAREAGGHPLLAVELARHAVVTGELVALRLEDAVLRAGERAGPDGRAVMTIVSLAHAPIATATVSRVTGLAGAALFAAIAALRDARLVATSGVGAAARLEPYHDRIRQVFVELPPARERELQRRIAEALEAEAADPELVALHWADAGQPAAAARHAWRAAEHAEVALAYHRAARLFGWVAELAPGHPSAAVRRAECLALAGRGVDAADAFLACAAHEVSRSEREGRSDRSGADSAGGAAVRAIDLRRRAMQQLLLMGHSARALALLDPLLDELGVANPVRRRRLVLALLVRRAAIRLRMARGVAPARPAPAPIDPVHRVRIDVLWDASVGLGMVEPVRALYLHSVGLALALAHGDAARLARALLADLPYHAAAGRPSRRLDGLIALADRAAAASGFTALAPLARGVVAFMSGGWAACQRLLADAEHLLVRDTTKLVDEGVGPVQLLDVARRFELVALFYLGRLPELGRRLPELLRDALDRNDLTSASHLRSGVHSLVHLAADDVDTAVRNNEDSFQPWRAGRGGIPHFMYVQAATAIDIYEGRAAEAHRRITAAWPALDSASLLRVQYMRASLLDIRGRAALAAAACATSADRARLVADARRCARRLRAAGARWSIPLGDALAAGAAALDGTRGDALTHLARAADGFAAADMALHALAAGLARARLAGDRAAAARERDSARTLGIRDVERFCALLVPVAG